MRDQGKVTAARHAAAGYLHRGWSVVPVPFRAKAPVVSRWQQLRIREGDLDRYFSDRHNIGVLLGGASNWLVDVDLDHALSLELATAHLPPTGAIFGRASKRRSHWLYVASRPVATRQWRLPNKQMVVELRSTGGQTVFPGSIHPSGEPIEWDRDGEPVSVDPDALQARLEHIFDEVCRRLEVPRPRSNATSAISNHTAPFRVIERARRYLAKLPPAVSGQGGHAATFRAACRLVLGFGLDRRAALALLHEWNDTHCDPPWTERELEHKVDDALKQPGWRGYLLTASVRRPFPASTSAIERANRHAIEHRRRARRRARV